MLITDLKYHCLHIKCIYLFTEIHVNVVCFNQFCTTKPRFPNQGCEMAFHFGLISEEILIF